MKVDSTQNIDELGVGRIRFIDALRGFTMTIVVFGHVMSSMGIGGYSSVLSSFFLTFRMPMFFFISGFIAFKPVEKWTSDFYLYSLKKKVKVQIIPALFFFTLFCLCHCKDPFNALSNGWGGYWFTFVLLEMFICYFTLSLIGHILNDKIVDIGMIIISFLGVAGIMFLRNHLMDTAFWNLLCLENTCKYFQFFTFGLLCRKYLNKFLVLINNDIFRASCILIFVCSFLLFFSARLQAFSSIIFSINHDILVRYSGLVVVFFFFYSKKYYWDSKNKVTTSFLFIGRRTLDIYLLHYFLLPDLSFLKNYIQSDSLMVIQFIASAAITLLIVGICLILSEVIRSSRLLGHYLLGAKLK